MLYSAKKRLVPLPATQQEHKPAVTIDPISQVNEEQFDPKPTSRESALSSIDDKKHDQLDDDLVDIVEEQPPVASAIEEQVQLPQPEKTRKLEPSTIVKLEENVLKTLIQISLLISNAETNLKRSHLTIMSEFEVLEFTNFISCGRNNAIFPVSGNNDTNKHITIKYHENIYINLPNSTKLLVVSTNRLRQELNNENGLEAILREGLRIIPKEHPDHATLRLQTGLEELQGGICYGMAACFLAQYRKERSQGAIFQEAAFNSAQLFTEGATIFASASHLIYCNARKSQEKIPYIFTNFRTDVLKCLSPALSVLQLLKEQINSIHLFDSLSSQLKLLKDGTYFIITEYRLENPEDRIPSLLSNGITDLNIYKKLHAVALLIEDRSFIIFDPNIGLLTYSDPDDFLRLYTHAGYGYMACISTGSNDTVDLLQEPKLCIIPNGGFLSDLCMLDSSVSML